MKALSAWFLVVTGTLIMGLLYASRYIAKLREAKIRLLRGLRELK